jgi:RHS repeat-associated protein
MRLFVRLAAIVVALLLSVSQAFAQAAPICDVTCSPDPSGGGYDSTVLSMTKTQNMRGNGSIFAQPAASTRRTEVLASAAVLPGSESYNYTIPVLSLPGRNGLDLNLALYYNSRVWDFDFDNAKVTFNTDRDFPTYGFHLGFGFLEFDSTNNEYALVEADGTKRQLSASGSVYVTTDSSFIQWTPSATTLFYKSGTRVFYQLVPGQTKLYRPFQIEDTNGNFISITYSSFPNGTGLEIDQITDTLGRHIKFNYDASDRLSTITQARPSPQTAITYITFIWKTVPLNYNFAGFTVTAPANASQINVLDFCRYANGTMYVFTWGDWGIIKKIEHKGANTGIVRNSVTYNYPAATTALSDHPSFTQETIYDGRNTSTWNYALTKSGNVVTAMSVTDPALTSTTTNLSPTTGLVTSVVIANGGTLFRTITDTWSTGANPVLTSVLTTLADSNQQSRTDFIYDGFGNVTDMKEYDFGLVYKRHTTTIYLHAVNGNYPPLHILDRPVQVINSHTELGYDGFTLTPVVGGPPPQWDNTISNSRANVTTIVRYADSVTPSQPVTRNFTYDTAGNLIGADLDCCQHRTWTYDSTTGFAYPVTVLTGSGTDTTTTHGTYDFFTGLPLTLTDENGKVTTFVNYDTSFRLTDLQRPDNVHITTSYDDQAGLATATTTTPIDTGASSIQVTTVDGAGHTVQQTLKDGVGNVISIVDFTYDPLGRLTSASNPHSSTETPVFTTTQYDAFGRISKTIPPDGSSASNYTGYSYFGNSVTITDPSGRQRKSYIDAFGRLTRVDEPGGTPALGTVSIGGAERSMCDPEIPLPRCVTIWDSGTVTITVNGLSKNVLYNRNSTATSIASALASAFNNDASAPVTASALNGVITFTSVESGADADYSFTTSSDTDDPTDFGGPSFDASPASGSLGGGADSGGSQSLLYPFSTFYTYDPADNLTRVAQGVQRRIYAYDGLGRLTSATTPESGTVNYSYMDFGAVFQRTDARGVITTNSYDGLNRLKQVSYNVGSTGVPATPTVSYTYGTSSANNNIGRLTTMTDGLGSESYSYDVLGRTTQISKIIQGKTYTVGYTYNLIGEVKTLTYPSGRVVTQSWDPVGRLQQIASAGVNYLTVPANGYNSASLPTQANYGNGVQANIGYGPRLQLSSLRYSHAGADMLNLAYSYNQVVGGQNVNNGQITQITDSTQPGRTVNYTYDPLSRIQTTSTAGSAAYPRWGLSWTYDRYGNRPQQTLTAGSGPASSFAIDPHTNRIIGDSYDANGNLTFEQGLNYSYTYDAENHLVNFNNSTTVFGYDGNDLRVVKTNAGSTFFYIYDRGNLIVEYLNGGTAPFPAREFIYSGNQYLATVSNGTTTYYHPDHLSIRLSTNADGTWAGEHGHFPFGEAWYDQGAFTRNAFTNYKRETESFTDYAMFRYYSNRQGRFQMSDPIGADTETPQTWNRYTYSENDPINNIDPLGLKDTPGMIGNCEVLIHTDDENVPNPNPPEIHILQCFDVVTFFTGPPSPVPGPGTGGGGAAFNRPEPPSIRADPSVKVAACYSEALKNTIKSAVGIDLLEKGVDLVDDFVMSHSGPVISPNDASQPSTGSVVSAVAGAAAGVGVVKTGAKILATNETAQQLGRQALREEGYKVSAKAVAKFGTKAGKILGPLSALFAGYSFDQAFQACMAK